MKKTDTRLTVEFRRTAQDRLGAPGWSKWELLVKLAIAIIGIAQLFDP
jgi:hypothetical protein